MHLFVSLLLLWAPQPTDSVPKTRFNLNDARILVRAAIEMVPERCISLGDPVRWDDPTIVMIMARSRCDTKSASSTIAPYFVDLKSGDVTMGMGSNPPITSERLKNAREQMLRRKSKSKR